MTCLLRTRGSTREMAQLFGAEAESGLIWPAFSWGEDSVPVIIEENDARKLTTMTWGLASSAFAKALSPCQRGTLYPRDFWRSGSRLLDPTGLSRCLILIESFAYPVGQAGRCTREWVGLNDHAIMAWAGVHDGDGCAGVLVSANPCVAPLSATMPRLLAPEDHGAWLDGIPLISLGRAYDCDACYHENLDERWSTGCPDRRRLSVRGDAPAAQSPDHRAPRVRKWRRASC